MPQVAARKVEKAQVSLPPPGGTMRFALLGGAPHRDNVLTYEKRQQYGIYYEMYRQHPVVRAAIDKKAAVAVAGGYQFVSSDRKNKVNERKATNLTRFFRRSNAKALLRLTYKDLDIYGESFWLVVRSMAESRTPMKAIRLNPRYMQPIVTGGMLTAWRYGPVMTDQNAITYPEELILHFKLEDTENDYSGLSPLHSLQRAVAQDLFAMEYNEAFFRNSAQTGTIFIVKTSDGDEAKRNREWLETNYVGSENAHRPLLLEGDVTVERSVSSPAEMQFLDGRRFLRQEILMVLEMDPDKVGLHEDSNRSVAKETDDSFHTESIWPRQNIVEEEINNELVDRVFGWADILFQHGENDPRRALSNLEKWERGKNAGLYSLNDVRDKIGEPRIDDEEADMYFVMTPAGLLPIGYIMEMVRASMQPAQPSGGVGTTGRPQPRTSVDKTPKLTPSQAEAVSQKE